MESSATWTARKTQDDQVTSDSECLRMSLPGTVLRFPRGGFGNMLFSSEGFFVCGLNLTADRCYITKNWNQSLRTLTFTNWRSLRKWLEEQKPGGERESLNIIAGDFVGPLPLCSLVIALNLKLQQKNTVI